MGQLNRRSVFRNSSSTTSLLIRTTLLFLAIGVVGLSGPGSMSDVSAQTSDPAALTEQPVVAASTTRAERRLPTRYVGDDSARQLLESQQVDPRALAAADFDEDGVPDLVSGYAANGAGIVTLHRGNVDAIFPNTPDAKRRKAAGRFSDSPFLAAARVFTAPAAPEFLHTGDFDTDGHSDVLVATKGGGALFLRGDGKGRLHAGERAELPPTSTTNQSSARAVATAGATAALAMRLNMDGRDDLVMLRPGQTEPLVSVTQVGTNFVVTNTNDSGPGSLRQAILDANATDNADGSPDLITFAIPGPGPHTITPLTPLPAVDPGGPSNDQGTVIIDATSQLGFAGSPVVEVSGAVVGTNGDGLTIRTPNSVVRGLAINRFAAGIRFSEGEFSFPTDSRVEGNHLGTDVSGTVDFGNGIGVVARGGITIGGTVAAARNIISGNGRGIEGADTVHVQGNFIGTDVSGTVSLGNDSQGVYIVLTNALIGGTASGARNIISGNGDDGVQVVDEVTFDISNNYIGTDVSGTRALGNAGDGIEVTFELAQGTISGNVLSANGGHGIYVPVAAGAIDVLNNRVGTNIAGTEALGNVRSGIWLAGGGSSGVIGNVVSGNREHGLVLDGLGRVVQNNHIGTNVTGTAVIGNGGDGLRLSGFGHTIGGLDSGQGNVIAFNGGDGLSFPNGDDTRILSNAIFGNGGLGIDLGDDGVTPNDVCDADAGVNELQNFPVLTAVAASASGTTIQGQLNSIPSATFQLQFFSSPAADPSGFGEGATLLGSTMVTTDSACNATFTVALPVAVAAGHVVTATATNLAMPSPFVKTSEFSNALAVVAQTPQEATRALIQQVRNLVAQGELNRILGFVLEVKLRIAIFFMDRDRFDPAIQQLRGFNHLVAVFVRTGKLGAAEGQELVDAANAIIVDLLSD
jgi:hypothetical protein